MRHLLTILLISLILPVYGQDDLLDELNEDIPERTETTIATFKGTRVVNGHSVETKGSGELEFIISHRFGRINTGGYNFWGLDQAFIRIGLEYGVTDKFGVGIGRNTFRKIFDGYLKYKLVSQKTGASSFPMTVTAFTGIGVQTFPKKEDAPSIEFNDRINYTAQLLIARKFNDRLSLQLSPSVVHYNQPDSLLVDKEQYALGFGGRYKITKSVSLNAEYFYRLDTQEQNLYEDLLAFGIDIETGGHVFQLIFSNTQGMTERTFINESQGDFFKGEIHFGFNITRTFQLGR